MRLRTEVAIQRFKLKKSRAAIILLDILKEDGKRETRRGRTRVWIRLGEEKGYNKNIVQELMIEAGYSRLPILQNADANDS